MYKLMVGADVSLHDDQFSIVVEYGNKDYGSGVEAPSFLSKATTYAAAYYTRKCETSFHRGIFYYNKETGITENPYGSEKVIAGLKGSGIQEFIEAISVLISGAKNLDCDSVDFRVTGNLAWMEQVPDTEWHKDSWGLGQSLILVK